MHSKILRSTLLVFLILVTLSDLRSVSFAQGPVGTAFIYQGYLREGSAGASGLYEFQFRLFDALTGGAQIGNTISKDVAVGNSQFKTELDFGVNPFNGQARYLELSFRPAGSSDPYTVLSPRQNLMPVPYALHTLSGGDDTLANLACASGQIAKWNGSAWVCGNDNGGGSGAGDGHSLDAADGDPVDALFVNSNGEVRIGSTNQSRNADLHIVDGERGPSNIYIESDVNGSDARLTLDRFESDNERAMITFATNGITDWHVGATWDQTAPGSFIFNATGDNLSGAQMVLRKDGRIGIGTATPNARLEIEEAPGEAALSLGGDGTTSRWDFSVVGPRDLKIKHTSLPEPSLFLRDNGHVGIGTGLPIADLHIVDDGTSNIYLESELDGSDARLTLDRFESNNERALISFATDGATDWNIGTTWDEGSPGSFIFNTGDDKLAGAEMIIQKDGRVGIGTTSPSADLHIVDNGLSNIHIESTLDDSDARLMLDRFESNNERALITFATKGKVDWHVGTTWDEGSPGSFIFNTGDDKLAGAEMIIQKDGVVKVKVLEITGGSDLAEPFAMVDSQTIKPGMVVAIDPDRIGQLRLADKAYDQAVAGVVSGAGDIQPGLVMQQTGTIAIGSHPVSLTGRVYVNATAVNGAIQPGDLLTTSDIPGYAMKVTDYEQAQGAVLGKAMSTLEEGTGLVLILVTLQ